MKKMNLHQVPRDSSISSLWSLSGLLNSYTSILTVTGYAQHGGGRARGTGFMGM